MGQSPEEHRSKVVGLAFPKRPGDFENLKRFVVRVNVAVTRKQVDERKKCQCVQGGTYTPPTSLTTSSLRSCRKLSQFYRQRTAATYIDGIYDRHTTLQAVVGTQTG